MINILVSAQMRRGTFEAKFIPLARLKQINKIYILRKEEGPVIDKVEYLVLPQICQFRFFSIILIPIFLYFYSLKLKPNLLLSYHLIPHAFFIYIVSKITGTPIIVCQTGGKIQDLVKHSILWFFIRKILNEAQYINVPGYQSKEFWKGKGIDSKKINVLHSTVDINYFRPEASLEIYDFIYVGSLNERKSVHKIILAVNEIIKSSPNTKLAIVGDGSLKGNLVRLANELSLTRNILFLGYQNDVKKLLLESKIFVMASKTEGLPVALMEAMACEKIVIAPSVDNIPSVLNENTGFLISNATISEFADKMRYALNQYHSLNSIRTNARNKIVKEYSYNYAEQMWNNIINEKIS